MTISIIVSALLAVAIVCFLNLTPERVTEDILSALKPNRTLREKASNIRHYKRKRSLYYQLMAIKTALSVTEKSRHFTLVCCGALVLFAIGVVVAVLINNLFLIPVLSVAFALLPFCYTANNLSFYEKHIKEELETTLSIITTSYVRSDDIQSAVRENLTYIKPPLKDVFRSFLGELTTVSPNIKQVIRNLREKVDDDIFKEWCDTLILCQDDRTLKDTLQPTVAKLTDVRIVNNELKAVLSNAKNEYLVMVALVVGNLPLLYLLNREWFDTLLYTTQGKVTIGICGAVILLTALCMRRFTKPITYQR